MLTPLGFSLHAIISLQPTHPANSRSIGHRLLDPQAIRLLHLGPVAARLHLNHHHHHHHQQQQQQQSCRGGGEEWEDWPVSQSVSQSVSHSPRRIHQSARPARPPSPLESRARTQPRQQGKIPLTTTSGIG
jgi:hypothetical protein